ncbi:MAG: PilN domain-containing protein [Gammaproteobacteria bacterium]|nr:PilN domain-containing protein [Gammaproteobacteria bacterium]MCF6261349.1 PilN domain-containing protein [Gammaproteobacteria bacterium]
MPHINLLPWREEERRGKQRQFINIAAGAAILMVGIVVLVHLRMNGIIDEQNNRNQFMQGQIAQVDKEIAEIKTLEKEKAALLARMKVIQELQSSRPEIVHIFDELAKTIPENVFLLETSRKGREINLTGVADANDYVSEFMRNLDNSPWLTNPRLTVIKSDQKEYPGASWFQLTVSQKNRTKKADK